MIILLPPSEGKETGGIGTWTANDGVFGNALGASRRKVISALRHAPATALKVRGDTAIHALRTNALLGRSPALPARERYTGVVYQGLDFPSLGPREKRLANSSIVIVSGLGGLVRFSDPIPDYRAAIDVRLDGLGRLSQFWKPHLAGILADLAKRHVIIDVLPQAHRVALTPVGDWRTVDIETREGVGGHAAKFAKGRFVRWLLSNDPDAITSWRDDGWSALLR